MDRLLATADGTASRRRDRTIVTTLTVLLAAAALGWAVLAWAGATAAAAEEGVTLEVTVTNDDSSPAEGVEVEIVLDGDPSTAQSATTDDEGKVTFDGLDPGADYEVTATHDDWSDSHSDTLPPSGFVFVEFTVGEEGEEDDGPVDSSDMYMPRKGWQVFGEARFAGRIGVADGWAVEEVHLFAEAVTAGGPVTLEVGVDDDPVGLAAGPHCDDGVLPCLVDGEWGVDWLVPQDLVEPQVGLFAEVLVCPSVGECLWEDVPLPDAFVNPKWIEIDQPAGHEEEGMVVGEVDLGAHVNLPGGQEADVDWRVAVFEPVRNVPLMSQHDFIEEADRDDWDPWMACAPVAAATSLDWLAREHGYDELLGDGDDADEQLQDLAEDLADDMLGTGDDNGDNGNGTSLGAFWEGIQQAIDGAGLWPFDADGEPTGEAGLGIGFAYYGDGHDDDDVDTPVAAHLRQVFTGDTDVMLALNSDQGADSRQHMVTVTGVRPLADGAVQVTVMDPWTGEHETFTINADGTYEGYTGIDAGFSSGKVDAMITVMPVAGDGGDGGGEGDAEAAATASSAGQGAFEVIATGEQAVWDTSGVAPGVYVVEARACHEGRCDTDRTTVLRGFDDVAHHHSHSGAIQACLDRAICGGFADATYRTHTSLTRGQMATFLVRALQLPDAEESHFDDTAGTTHEEAIDAVAAAGIALGVAEGTFAPNDDITRGQMASFLDRALALPAGEPGSFDDTAGTTHEEAIDAIAAAGITEGVDEGVFGPYLPVTRGQMATFLIRALDG